MDSHERLIRELERAMLRRRMSQTALADELSSALGRNYDKSMINKVLKGRRSLSAMEMAAISKILDDPEFSELGKPTGWLFEGTDDQDRPATVSDDQDGTFVPVFDVEASAGYGSIAEYEPQTTSLAFPPDYLKRLTSSSPRNLAIISVKGDSMEPTLLDHDIVLLDMSKKNLSYDGLFVLRFDEALHVKRVGRAAKPGRITIISDNVAFPPITADREDIEAVGKVLWYGRKV